jgi:creatinine amidohydrolase
VAFGQVKSLVQDACRALADLGARRVVLMTFHGSPLHNIALFAGVKLLAARGIAAIAPMNLLLQALFHASGREDLEPMLAHIEDPTMRAAMLQDLRLDFHAGFVETSAVLHYAPASVSPVYRRLPPCPRPARKAAFGGVGRAAARVGKGVLARELEFASKSMGWFDLRPFPGYTGRPSLATAEAGRWFAQRVACEYACRADAVFSGKESSPGPIMEWISTLSVDGLLAPASKIRHEELATLKQLVPDWDGPA